ncbi:hypothetical protein OF83DRAFT_424645 [Amylostereum chailletii]|nr:hypothetical protein OF83DRAFT_424645 [Amylostereum chailletii]
MDALWNIVSHYLPSIRIQNDFDDAVSDLGTSPNHYELPVYHSRAPPQPRGRRSRDDARATSRRQPENIDEPPRTKELELCNQRLQAELLTLKRQHHHLHADLSTTKLELDHQRSVNVHLLSQKSRLETELAQANAARKAQASEIHHLRSSFADMTSAASTPEARDEELATLKSFLNKTDEFSGAQILQSVQDLNTEILQLAAAVSEEFPLSRREGRSWKKADCELVRASIGGGMLELLKECDHEEDPTVVQLAVQAWEVAWCERLMNAFCHGLPPDVDSFLRDVFQQMQTTEPQATTSRWRALTHMHARALLSASQNHAAAPPLPSSASSSSSCSSPLFASPQEAYPTPLSTMNNTPASQILALPSTRSAASSIPSGHPDDNIHGLIAILALAGCTDERGTSVGPLAERFGDSVARIAELAESLARAVREGVSSAWFDVRVEDGRSAAKKFDGKSMENVYAGFGDECANVLCSITLGLAVVKRKNGEEDEKDKDGPLESTLLLKPKVILESVKALL